MCYSLGLLPLGPICPICSFSHLAFLWYCIRTPLTAIHYCSMALAVVLQVLCTVNKKNKHDNPMWLLAGLITSHNRSLKPLITHSSQRCSQLNFPPCNTLALTLPVVLEFFNRVKRKNKHDNLTWLPTGLISGVSGTWSLDNSSLGL